MEHIERAGIHSGDSISVYPAQSLTQKAKDKIAEYTRRLAKSLHVIGLIIFSSSYVEKMMCM